MLLLIKIVSFFSLINNTKVDIYMNIISLKFWIISLG